MMEKIQELARMNNGMVTAAQAQAAGVARSRLSEMARCGQLERVGRGVYCLPGTWEDELLLAQARFPRGVFSDGTALFLHNFTDRTPERLTMTFPRSYNASGPRACGIEVRTCANEVLKLGLTRVVTPCGNEVAAYDLERTLCDIVRGQAQVDVQVVNPAMRAYAGRRGADVQKLMGYAKALGVEGKVRAYMEVLL